MKRQLFAGAILAISLLAISLAFLISAPAFAGQDDACEVDWVGCRYRDRGNTVAASGGAEGVNGVRESELLAAEAGDEAAAANLTASFKSAKDAEKVAPAGSVGLAS